VRRYDWRDDPVLRPLIEAATADPAVVGLLLAGSRGDGWIDDDSDYDVYVVLRDEVFATHGHHEPLLGGVMPTTGLHQAIELLATCPTRLAELAATPGWWTAGYATAQILLDKDGTLVPLLDTYRSLPSGTSRDSAAASLDGYLNAFYRSLKAWYRGDELGARLHAGISVIALVRALFALMGRPAPYHDRLWHHLDALVDQQWPPGYLQHTFLTIIRTATPPVQRELAERVEPLMRERGLGYIIDAWGDQLEHIKARVRAGE
jgi:hypothetical protein